MLNFILGFLIGGIIGFFVLCIIVGTNSKK